MPKTATAPAQLKKGAKVVATTELRGVPEGTEGKVIMVTGLTWIRYWVRFDNGVSLGQISRHQIATRKELEAPEVEGPASSGADDADGAAAEGGGDEGGGGVTTPNGTFIPQKFIERAAAARARLSGG